MPARSSTRRPFALLAVGVLTLVAAGCRPEDPAIHDARRALRHFTVALRAQNEAELRALATCVVEAAGVQDARLRHFESLRTIRLASLDSLAIRYGQAQWIADSLYTAAPDSTGDLEKRFERTRNLARRAALTRAALRAADQSMAALSAPAKASMPAGSNPILQTIRAHLLVRYAGAAVGPAPIDRDVVVRLLRAPAGPWVVYGYDLASDAPGPVPF